MSFYAVRRGHNAGIFDSWKDVVKEIKSFPLAKLKKFPTKDEAIAFLIMKSPHYQKPLLSLSLSNTNQTHFAEKENSTRYIFIDIETTGFSYKLGDKIVEIACLFFDKDGSSIIFDTYVNPERMIPRGSINIHGITNDIVKGAPTFREIGQQLLDFIGSDGVLVGHNIKSFDIPFINNELRDANLELINGEMIDTLDMFRKIFPGQSSKLDNVCKMLDIDLSERAEHGHGALLDAKLTADCFNKMSIKLALFKNKTNAKNSELTKDEDDCKASYKNTSPSVVRKILLRAYDEQKQKKYKEQHLLNLQSNRSTLSPLTNKLPNSKLRCSKRLQYNQS